MIIETPRLRLRCWEDRDRDAFATMNADPEVMHDLGGVIDRTESDAKLDRYALAFRDNGFSRWVVENRSGDFLGYAGVVRRGPDHPLGLHDEIGWRLVRHAWGFGYATEAARAALEDAFTRGGLEEVASYTSPENIRSQAVMARLKMRREPALDFTAPYDRVGMWTGLVWVAKAAREAV